jgi:hypothetical protein
VLHTAPGSARGGYFSKGLAGYNIGNVQQFLKNNDPWQRELKESNMNG